MSQEQASSRDSAVVCCEPVEDLVEREFQRLVHERAVALASVPYVPQTIMDLLEDAPEHTPEEPSEADIAEARMKALRYAYEQRQPTSVYHNSFHILSWNIDGLDVQGHEDFLSRLAGVVKQILDTQPAVVYLQEVVDPMLDLLRLALERRYEIITPDPKLSQYYVAVLVSRTRVQCLKETRTVSFRNSKMGRQVLIAQAELHGGKTGMFLTSHLESSKEGAQERKSQLRMCLQIVNAATADLIAFAGDLNLRDREAKQVLQKFEGIEDAWEYLGSDQSQRYTWDTSVNTNCGINGPRARFDRLYFKAEGIAPVGMKLVGTARLPSGRFASDHWALATMWPILTAPICSTPRAPKRRRLFKKTRVGASSDKRSVQVEAVC